MRLENWDQRLVQAIAAHQAEPFSWRGSNCGTLFADCVEAVTGEDPLADVRGWRSERGALQRLAATGFDSVAACVAARFEPIPLAEARRGDAGYTAEAEVLGFPAIICGAFAMSRDANDWVIVPRARLVRCFRVG